MRAGACKVFECKRCRHQASLLAGTVFQDTKLLLPIWFLAIYLNSQAKTGLSTLVLKRQLGVSYPTACLIQHGLTRVTVLADREDRYQFEGKVQVVDAYLGGEPTGGKVGRGPENKVAFVAAMSLTEEHQPLRVRLTPVPGLTLKAGGPLRQKIIWFRGERCSPMAWPALVLSQKMAAVSCRRLSRDAGQRMCRS